ncbi:hypothetical protein Tco_1566256 [Tanacetum coccineum]
MASNKTYTCSPSEICLLDSDSKLLIPTPWSDESKNEKGQKYEEKNSNGKDPCLILTLQEVILNNNIGKQSGDLVEMPIEAVEQGIDDHVPDEIDGVKCEQLPNHVVNQGNLEVLVCKQVANHDGDELVDKGRLLRGKGCMLNRWMMHYFVSKVTTLVKQSSSQTPLEKLQGL